MKRIFLSSPHMSEEGYEQEFVREAFNNNWLAPGGENVDYFEQEFASIVHSKSAVALTSGTSALHMSLVALGVGQGDTVICSTSTFVASANPILYQGATPVFVDSDKKTWNMSPEKLEEALRKYPQTKAVIVVHLYGLSCDMDRIVQICDKYNVPIIEDAAEALGTLYKGKNVGTIGEFGFFSFNGNKIITASGGGMLLSDNKEKLEKVRFWASQAKDVAEYYHHSELGYNYRMSNVLAGIGRGQLKVLEQRIRQKRDIYNYYQKRLGHIKEIEFMPEHSWCKPNYWLSVILVDSYERTEQIIQSLRKEDIEARHFWKPMHMQPLFQSSPMIGGEVSEELFEKGVCLPSDTKMTVEDIERVCTVIERNFRGSVKIALPLIEKAR